AELPGVALADRDVSVIDGTLTLAGKRDAPEGVEDARYLRAERYRGSWKRSLPLPERVVADEMSASFSHGVLKIRLPRAPEARPRQIRVTPGEEPS
ncbi:MAG: Hsp20/alpha crystallin family protein, partial [Planctomycetota bacterium]